MATRVVPRSIEDIAMQARVYPAYLLPEEGTALALFAAGFHGWNDVIHFALRGLDVTCVDTNPAKMREMADVYPERYEFWVGDAWEFAERAVHDGRNWDVVSADCSLGDINDRVLDSMYLWTSLARSLLTITVAADTRPPIPDGWLYSYMPRSGTADWLILTRR